MKYILTDDSLSEIESQPAAVSALSEALPDTFLVQGRYLKLVDIYIILSSESLDIAVMFNSEMFRRILLCRGLKSPDKICL